MHALSPLHSPQTDAGAPALPDSTLALALMDAVACGLVACDQAGRVLQANRAARREFAAGDVLWLDDGTLCCDSADRSDLRRAVLAAARDRRCGLIGLGSDSKRLMVVAMPLPTPDGDTPVALLMLGLRSPYTALSLQMLAHRHGLTEAEQRVLRGLCATLAPRQIAATHGVSVTTVRTQIQSLRDKVGVRTIDGLLMQVAQLPPVGALA